MATSADGFNGQYTGNGAFPMVDARDVHKYFHSNQVLRGTLANYGARFIGIATWFFITPEVLRALGEAGFGLWVLAAALIGYGSLLDLGIGGAITKFVAEYRARSEDARIKELIGSALLIDSCVGIAVAVVTLVLVPISDALFGGVQGDANVMRT